MSPAFAHTHICRCFDIRLPTRSNLCPRREVCCTAGAIKAGQKAAWGQAETRGGGRAPRRRGAQPLARALSLPSSGTIPALNVTEPQRELRVMRLPLIFSWGDSGLREFLYKNNQLSQLLSPVPSAGPHHVAPADRASTLALLRPYLLQPPRARGDTSHDPTCCVRLRRSLIPKRLRCRCR